MAQSRESLDEYERYLNELRENDDEAYRDQRKADETYNVEMAVRELGDDAPETAAEDIRKIVRSRWRLPVADVAHARKQIDQLLRNLNRVQDTLLEPENPWIADAIRAADSDITVFRTEVSEQIARLERAKEHIPHRSNARANGVTFQRLIEGAITYYFKVRPGRPAAESLKSFVSHVANASLGRRDVKVDHAIERARKYLSSKEN